MLTIKTTKRKKANRSKKAFVKLLVQYKVKAPVTTAWLKRLSSLVLRSVKGPAFEKNSELSIVLTGDHQVRALNRLHRGKDKTTDVLSFPLLEGKKLRGGKDGAVVLGDVVVSVPQAKRQANARGAELSAELALLLTHGILHLLGYDHATLSQEKKMFSLQERLLRKFRK